jgi:hypothetical protein
MHRIEMFQKLSEQQTVSVKYFGLFIKSLLFSLFNIFFLLKMIKCFMINLMKIVILFQLDPAMSLQTSVSTILYSARHL